MRRNAVTLVAVLIAIAASLITIQTKREAAQLRDPPQPRLNGVPVTVEQQAEVIEKLKTRIGLLQKCLSDHDLAGAQPAPDDGLQLPGVYPHLVYDRTIK